MSLNFQPINRGEYILNELYNNIIKAVYKAGFHFIRCKNVFLHYDWMHVFAIAVFRPFLKKKA